MKKTKLFALILVVSITMTISCFQMKETNSQKVGLAIGYVAVEHGMSNKASLGLGVAFTLQSSLQGLMWGAVFGGPVGAAVGLGWSL